MLYLAAFLSSKENEETQGGPEARPEASKSAPAETFDLGVGNAEQFEVWTRICK